jgi:hypothetical protein
MYRDYCFGFAACGVRLAARGRYFLASGLRLAVADR